LNLAPGLAPAPLHPMMRTSGSASSASDEGARADLRVPCDTGGSGAAAPLLRGRGRSPCGSPARFLFPVRSALLRLARIPVRRAPPASRALRATRHTTMYVVVRVVRRRN